MASAGKSYDTIIIGSGQGGNPLSQKLASRHEQVALIEGSRLGGTCINTGCTPTKTMVASAQVAHYARNASHWGVKTVNTEVDLPAIVARKNKVVEEYRSGWQTKVDRQETLHLYRGWARFVGPKQLQVGEDVLEAARIFIDTGSKAAIPQIPGLDSTPYLTNESILELTTLPSHLIVLGGGYIGLEFGQMFRRFGSQVTVIQHGAHILPMEDLDVEDALQRALAAEEIAFLLGAKATAVSGASGALTVTAEINGATQKISGSHLLIAIGRKPNTDFLDPAKAGIATDEQGHIKVNDRLETNVEGIWALGDVNGGPAFTHISYNDFQIIYGNLYEGKSLSTKDRILPYAVFTDPQLGRVGLSEKAARAAGKKLKIGTYPMTSVARAVERGETQGLMKIVVDAENDHVLGASILSADGGEVVQILHTLMLAEKPYTLLKGAIYIHPTIAEGFFGLLESVKPAD